MQARKERQVYNNQYGHHSMTMTGNPKYSIHRKATHTKERTTNANQAVSM
jgi:hypothetical protein